MSLPYMKNNILNNTEYIIGLQKGNTHYSEGTFDCNDYKGCIYCHDGRCIWNVAAIQQKISKACYEDDIIADSEYYN